MKRLRGVTGGATGAGRTRLLCGLALFLLFAPPVARAQGPDGPSLETKTCDSSLADLLLDMKIRKALKTDTDPRVQRLASSFSVHHGMVIFFGTVPSEEVMKRAIREVSAVPGVGQVRSEAIVFQTTEPQPQLRLPLTTEPTRTRSASIHPLSDSSVRGAESAIPRPPRDLRPDRTPLPSSRSRPTQTIGREIAAPMPVRAAPTTRAAPDKVPLSAPPTVSLLPPRPVADTQAHQPAPISSVTAAIDSLRRGDGRFRSIHVEVEAGVVHLTAPDTPAEDLATFAQAISQITGVVRVVVCADAP